MSRPKGIVEYLWLPISLVTLTTLVWTAENELQLLSAVYSGLQQHVSPCQPRKP